MTTVQVRFQGHPYRYTAVPFDIPSQDNSFEPMPANATSIIVPQSRSIFINRYADRRRIELTLDEARTWEYGPGDETEMIFAQAKTTGTSPGRFCLRMIFDLRSYRAYQRLLMDADFHSTHLSDADGHGVLVPAHYGMWLMDTGNWAGKVFLSITQWCGISWNEISYTKANTEANRCRRILVGRTFEALHDYGIALGGLRSSTDTRHFLFDINTPGLTKTNILNGRTPCYVVGFSDVEANHECQRKLPILPHGSFVPFEKVGCREIASVSCMLKFMKKSEPATSASVALQWHDEYSKRYPTMSNLDVLMAQRAKLYTNMPPVYSQEAPVSFANDELTAGAATDPLQRPDMEDPGVKPQVWIRVFWLGVFGTRRITESALGSIVVGGDLEPPNRLMLLELGANFDSSQSPPRVRSGGRDSSCRAPLSPDYVAEPEALAGGSDEVVGGKLASQANLDCAVLISGASRRGEPAWRRKRGLATGQHRQRGNEVVGGGGLRRVSFPGSRRLSVATAVLETGLRGEAWESAGVDSKCSRDPEIA
ncbi:hypothetical protein B0H16DRAFT_1694062 [Mycena metata]|uniref:Uncharacterized protein n=1 Tax=Mycena metata TaxID=1033252 RepID=A0AAD7IFV2_9AGAR|nr:hypothetical protein B0H16DRAFT_1694062 [Mycena metata]